MNKLSFAGRLAADAEVRFTPGGDPICGFRVASDVGYGDKKTTNWFSCQIWGKRGEALAPHLTKGQQVTVWGTLTLREWQDKNGVTKTSADVRVDEIALQGGKQAAEQPARPAPARQAKPQGMSQPGDYSVDDVPF